MNNPALDNLKLQVQYAISEGVTLANRKYKGSAPGEYETMLRDALNNKLADLTAALPALLFNTGLADSFKEDYKYAFTLNLKEIKNASFSPINLPPHFKVVNKNIYDIDCYICIETLKSKSVSPAVKKSKPAAVPVSGGSGFKKGDHPAHAMSTPAFYEKKNMADYFSDAVIELIKEPCDNLIKRSGNLSDTGTEITSKGALILNYAGYGGAIAGTILSGAEQIQNISIETFATPGSNLIIAGIGFIPYPDCQ